jgi:hypothetical protein
MESVMTVNASYKVLAVEEKVLVKIPGGGDKHFKWVEAHEIKARSGPHSVAEHYRRGDYFGGRFVTRRFFVEPDLVGKTTVATVKVVEKTDHQKGGQKALILEIYPREGSPTSKLKVGSPTGEFPIPGAKGKHVAFEKM